MIEYESAPVCSTSTLIFLAQRQTCDEYNTNKLQAKYKKKNLFHCYFKI
jgi:hypothetical protein